MIVRPFLRKDFDKLWDLAQKMWRESPAYQGIEISEEKLRRLGERILKSQELCGFVAENGDGIQGFFAGFVSEYYFGNQNTASDLALFVDPGKRGGRAAILLIRAYEQWARSHGVEEISLGITTGVNQERTAQLYERLGYTKSGIICRKKIERSA